MKILRKDSSAEKPQARIRHCSQTCCLGKVYSFHNGGALCKHFVYISMSPGCQTFKLISCTSMKDITNLSISTLGLVIK